jgi:hypothetical protein
MNGKRMKAVKTKEADPVEKVNPGDLIGQISEAAYGIYVRSGFVHGNDKRDWLEAEKMIYSRK